jgi:hypothetical protein
MASPNYLNMDYSELVNSGKTNNDLSDLVIKFEENSCDTTTEADIPEPTIVIIKESTVPDEDARLPYENKEQTIYAHALIHLWWNIPNKTKWSRLQVSREHTRIVAKLVSNSWGHMLYDSLDESLPNSLMKDFLPSNGEEAVKPSKIVIVNNSKESPIVEIGKDDVSAIKVILNQSTFESSVNNMEEDDQEYKKFLNNDVLNIEEKDDAIYLRINAMHEGTWNFTEISRRELEKAAPTYTGRLVIEAHKWDDPERAIGEVLKASVKFDADMKKYYLEVIAKITKDRAIKEVKAKRYKFVSIGASMQARCNICGMTVSEGCDHIRGIEYDTREHGRLLCAKIASDIIFEELSFINVPAARWARVLEQLDPNQARELLAASKSRSTFSIEVESENTRILPTLDEFLTLQEESIIKFYNRKEEVCNMAQDNKQEVINTEEAFVASNDSDSTPDAVIPQNPTINPEEKIEQSMGNVSKVEVPTNPLNGGTVDTGNNEASKVEAPKPIESESDPKVNVSDVPVNQHPLDGGTVKTNEGVNTTGDTVVNPLVCSDAVTEDNSVQNDTLSLTNEQIDEMNITSIYEYAKSKNMNTLVDTLTLANEEECKNITIDAKFENEAILAHAVLHMWLDDLTLTNWAEEAIKAEHDRIVQVLESFGIGHEEDDDEEDDDGEEGCDSSKTVVEPNTSEVIVESTNSSEVSTLENINENVETIEKLNGEIEVIKQSLESTKTNYEAIILGLNQEKEKVSNEIYTLKLNVAKLNRSNKKLESDLTLANNVIAEKTTEIEVLNNKLDTYSKKEFNEVVSKLVAVKTDMNKYADEDSLNKDREKFSSMNIDSLNAILDELLVVKENSLKNTVAKEFGLGEVLDVKTDKVELKKNETIVDGNLEIQSYQKEEGETEKKDVTNNTNTTQEEVVENNTKTFAVREGSVLSLVKKSLEL